MSAAKRSITDGALWSFARICINAGMDHERIHVSARTLFEEESARIDALARTLQENFTASHQPLVNTEVPRWPTLVATIAEQATTIRELRATLDAHREAIAQITDQPTPDQLREAAAFREIRAILDGPDCDDELTVEQVCAVVTRHHLGIPSIPVAKPEQPTLKPDLKVGAVPLYGTWASRDAWRCGQGSDHVLVDGASLLVDESRRHQLRAVGNGGVPLCCAVAVATLTRELIG